MALSVNPTGDNSQFKNQSSGGTPVGYERLMQSVKNLESHGDYHTGCCPAHDDNKSSLSISIGDDGRALVKCHTGCSTFDICKSVGIEMKDLFPPRSKGGRGGSQSPRGKIVATYDYHDSQGVLIFQVCRMDPKAFLQRRPDGVGGWTWKTKGLTKVLYRLPELLAAKSGDAVFVGEGEKDVDNLRTAFGVIATTNPGGADENASKWLKSYSQTLKGRHVVLLPDNDPQKIHANGQPMFHADGRPVRVGQDFMAAVAASLHGLAASIRIVNLPGLPIKGDVSDWIAAGGTREQLEQLAKETPVYAGEVAKVAGVNVAASAAANTLPAAATSTPASTDIRDPAATHYELQITNELEIDVLGFVDGGGRVKIWSRSHRRCETVDVDKLSYAGLLRLCGPVAKAKVSQGKEAGPGEYTLGAVKSAIALLAGYRKVSDETEVSAGVWEGIDEAGHPTKALILVGAGESGVMNGEPGLKRIESPKYGGRIFDTSHSQPWFDLPAVSQMIIDYSPEWAMNVISDAGELFGRWRWKNPAVAPEIMVGCVLATWIQTTWKWRPQIAILGESKSGKSMLFSMLGGEESSLGLFGHLGIKSSQSTAAGIRQRLQRSAAIAICDEYDSTAQRKEILEMIRASSRGDSILRGTSSQKGQGFALRHIFWLAGITVDFRRAPDRNRFIVMELELPADEDRGKLTLPDSERLEKLGQQLLTVALKNCHAARELAKELRTVRIAGIDDRVIESYSVPAAMLASVYGLSLDNARGLLERLTANVSDDESGEKDHETLLTDILTANVQVGGGKVATVAQILADDGLMMNDAMEASGVATVTDVRGPRGNNLGAGHDKYLFIAGKVVSKKLLRGSDWEGQSVEQILSRIPGAEKTKRRIAGASQRGVVIPWLSVSQIHPPEAIMPLLATDW